MRKHFFLVHFKGDNSIGTFKASEDSDNITDKTLSEWMEHAKGLAKENISITGISRLGFMTLNEFKGK